MSVLVVEAHALVRAALHALISAADGLCVVAEAGTVSAAAELARRHRPDVVLIDGRTLSRDHSTDLQVLRDAAPDACVLILADEEIARHGAPGVAHRCLPCTAGVEELYDAVTSILGPRCATCSLRPFCPVPPLAAALSRRERQVAVRVANGMSSKQIAAALGIGLRTVNTYRESLARKVGASSPAMITRFVLTAGVTEGVLAPAERDTP